MENTTGKKNLIINIAFGYFLNIGYEATTVRMICKEANIEPPTLYYYFGSKKGLFFAVVDKMLADYQEMGQINSKEGSMHPEKLLEAIYENSIKYAITHKNETKFYLRYTLFTIQQMRQAIDEITTAAGEGAQGTTDIATRVTDIASKTDDVLHQSMENQKSAEKLDEMVGFFQL